MAFHRGPKIVTDGLVLYLDAANPKSYVSSSTTTNSLVGSVTGSLLNGVGYSSESNGSWTFDGSNDFVNTQNISFTANIDFTLIVMIKSDIYSSSGGILANKGYWSSGGQGVAIGNISVPQTIYGYVTTDTGHYSVNSNITTPYDWNHVVLRRLSNNLVFYVNGSKIGNGTTISGTVTDLSPFFTIGGHSNAGGWNGNMSFVQIYNRALSADEILQNYNATKSRFGL